VSRAGFTEGDSTDATGTMDPQAFRFVYRHNAPQIAACYSSATRTRTVAGVITVRVRIAQSGQVARTRVLSDTTHDPDLARCVQGRIQTWRYPQPEGGEVEVDYPLRFGSP
jgi:TonB family protein